MKPELIILGYMKKMGPASGNEIHENAASEFPGFAKIPRPSIYRHLSKLEGTDYIKRAGTRPARGKDNILYKVTAAGGRRFKAALAEVEVEVEHPARPALTTPQFGDYLVLCLLYSSDLGLDAIRRRVASIRKVLRVRDEVEVAWDPAQALLNCAYLGFEHEIHTLQLVAKGLESGLYD